MRHYPGVHYRVEHGRLLLFRTKQPWRRKQGDPPAEILGEKCSRSRCWAVVVPGAEYCADHLRRSAECASCGKYFAPEGLRTCAGCREKSKGQKPGKRSRSLAEYVGRKCTKCLGVEYDNQKSSCRRCGGTGLALWVLGMDLRDLRQELHLTQKTVASVVGVTRSAIAQLEAARMAAPDLRARVEAHLRTIEKQHRSSRRTQDQT